MPRRPHQAADGPSKAQQLDYASAPLRQEANPRRMFALLLPAGVVAAVFLASWMIEDGDSRNIGGALCVLVTAPVALACGIMALVEATRPRGLRALAQGMCWAALLVGGLYGSLWVIIHFKLLQG